MLELIAQYAGYAALYLFLALLFAGLVGIALAERTGPVEDDQFTPELPWPGPVHLEERVPADEILEARRLGWKAVDKCKKAGQI